MTVNHYVGIDVSKADFYVCLNEDDRPQKYDNTATGITRLLHTLKTEQFHPTDTLIGLESTGPYHYRLAFVCAKHGYVTHVINPLITNAYAKTNIRKTKTDTKDAALIRQVLTQGAGYAFTETIETFVLKNLVRTRAYISDLKRNTHRKALDITYKEAIVKTSITNSNHKLYAMLSKEMKVLDRTLRTYQASTQRLLQSIPGVGPVTAASLVAEITDIHRFPSVKQFIAFIGLDPRTHESGTSVHGRGYITKRGNKILRTLFYNGASVAIQRTNPFQTFYVKKVAEGKSKMVALVATTHKLAKVAYAVWKTNTPFDQNHGVQTKKG